MKDTSFEYLKTLIERHTGILLTSDKKYLLEARFSSMCKAHGLGGIDELCIVLQSARGRLLIDEIIERITTNETSFFRDREPFKILERTIIPELLEARGAQKTLRIWSAASSSGQEAYSMAMVLEESFPQLSSWDVQIIGTDISPAMVERCGAGIYSEHEISRGLSKERLQRHFTKLPDGRYQVSQALNDRVKARRLNLLEAFPSDFRFDLVLMRNVLIYFEQENRDRILTRVHGALRPGGFLMLGTAESPRGDQFVRGDVGSASVFRRAA